MPVIFHGEASPLLRPCSRRGFVFSGAFAPAITGPGPSTLDPSPPLSPYPDPNSRDRPGQMLLSRSRQGQAGANDDGLVTYE